MGRPKQGDETVASRIMDCLEALIHDVREEIGNATSTDGGDPSFTMTKVNEVLKSKGLSNTLPPQVSLALAKLVKRGELYKVRHGVYSVSPVPAATEVDSSVAAEAKFSDILISRLNAESEHDRQCKFRIYLNGTSIGKHPGFLLGLQRFCSKCHRDKSSRVQVILLSPSQASEIYARNKFRSLSVPCQMDLESFTATVERNLTESIGSSLGLLSDLRTIQSELPGALGLVLNMGDAVVPYFIATGGAREMVATSRRRSSSGSSQPSAFVTESDRELELAAEFFDELWALGVDLSNANDLLELDGPLASDKLGRTLMTILLKGSTIDKEWLKDKCENFMLEACTELRKRIDKDWRLVARANKLKRQSESTSSTQNPCRSEMNRDLLS